MTETRSSALRIVRHFLFSSKNPWVWFSQAAVIGAVCDASALVQSDQSLSTLA